MANETKHTPGPWRVWGGGERVFMWDIVGPRGEDIAYANENDGSDDCPVRYPVAANAALIAASPTLLDALKVTAGNIRSLGPAGVLGAEYRVWLRVVEEAIAKSEPSFTGDIQQSQKDRS